MKIGKVANLLGSSTATVRNWMDRFEKEKFTESATRQEGKNFFQWDIDQLLKIQDLKGQGKSWEEISHQLDDVPENVPLVEPEFVDQPSTSTQIVAKEYIDVFMQQQQEIVAAYKHNIADKDQQIAELKEEIAELRKPWYKKVFR